MIDDRNNFAIWSVALISDPLHDAMLRVYLVCESVHGSDTRRCSTEDDATRGCTKYVPCSVVGERNKRATFSCVIAISPGFSLESHKRTRSWRRSFRGLKPA